MMQMSSNSTKGQHVGESAHLGYSNTNDEIISELNSKYNGGDGTQSITPRTGSQRQASRSFKHQHETSDNGVSASRALEESQFSIEDLQVRQQKSSEKTPSGTMLS